MKDNIQCDLQSTKSMLNFDPNRQTYTKRNKIAQNTHRRKRTKTIENAMGNNKRPLTDCLISIIEI